MIFSYKIHFSSYEEFMVIFEYFNFENINKKNKYNTKNSPFISQK